MLTRLVTRLSDSHPWVSGYNKLFFQPLAVPPSLLSPLGDYTSIIEGTKVQIYDLLSSFMRSLWIGTHAQVQELFQLIFSPHLVRRDIKLQGLSRIVQKKILLIFYLMFCLLPDWSTILSIFSIESTLEKSLEIHIMFTNWAFSLSFDYC